MVEGAGAIVVEGAGAMVEGAEATVVGVGAMVEGAGGTVEVVGAVDMVVVVVLAGEGATSRGRRGSPPQVWGSRLVWTEKG